MKRSLVVVLLIGFVSVSPGCRKDGKHPAEQADGAKAPEAPPSDEQLKKMISRAASMPVKAFDAITMAPIGTRSALRYSRNQPLTTLMILTPIFVKEERDAKIELPVASSTRPLSAPPQDLIINIRANGDIMIANRVFKDEQALRKLLRRVAETDANQKVLIRCDGRAPYEHFARVAGLCREAGISKANIGFTLPAPDVTATAPAPPKPAPPAAKVAPPAPPATSKPAPRDLRFLFPGGLGKAAMLARALRGRGNPPAKAAGEYVSVIWPEYITEFTRNVKGDTITGKVSFRAEDVYEGTVEYTAGRGPKGWRIEEFRLPMSGRRTVLTVHGTWMATPDPASDRPVRPAASGR